jgi:hypothetical protein
VLHLREARQQLPAHRLEIPADIDTDAALDLLARPFVVRAVIGGGAMDDAWSEKITPMLIRALGANTAAPVQAFDGQDRGGLADPLRGGSAGRG